MPDAVPLRRLLPRRGLGTALTRVVHSTRTIRGRIVLAFLAMSVITAGLGGFATHHILEAGDLAGKTFDQSLMSVSYARAAAADFAAMQVAFGRRSTARTVDERRASEQQLEQLRHSLSEDLTIAGERSLSERAVKASRAAARAANAWETARQGLTDRVGRDGGGRDLDEQASAVEEQIDLLVNYTAGDGFLYRQAARQIIAADIRANVVGTGLALLMAAVVVWLLARRIIGPVAMASAVANEIAGGKLDGPIPEGNGDELGALLSAMAVMRTNLRTMMEREVTQRRSAQTRLADALDSSQEGIVVVDAGGQIAMANAQVATLLALPQHLLKAGTPLAALEGALERPLFPSGAERSDRRVDPLVTDIHLDDGRWLRVSRNATQDRGFVAVISDLTPLKAQEERLRGTNASLDAALENMSQGLCLYDAEGRLKVYNSRYQEIFHLEPGRLRAGLPFREVFKIKVEAGNYQGLDVDDLLAARTKNRGRSTGEACFEELTFGRTIAIAHRATHEGGWVATYEDVTERRAAEKQVRFLACHDALTRLPNRTLFSERIDQALMQLGRGGRFAVLCLDLDRFKQINDTLGHPTGDALLQRVAERLLGCVHETDTVARLGGDEFAVIQTHIETQDDAFSLARRIVEALSAPFAIDDQTVSIGVSIGLATAPDDAQSASGLLKNADAALYRAKADGRGTWRCFEPDMDMRLQIRRTLENDLRTGLAEGQFELFYQPFYDLGRDRICGFEALLRWNHPVRGQVQPSEFIAVAEEIGLIVPLGDWVLRRACQDASLWPEGIKVAVNVSPAQFGSTSLIGSVEAALLASSLSPSRLELEITETVLLTKTDDTLDVLDALRSRGIKIAMDDFGTGYSSLSYLRRFPFDRLKIDRSFIQDVTTSADSGAIVRAILALGSSLGIMTTAEGVEDVDQLIRLRAEGCNEIQGYYVSKPIPVADVADLIARWSTPTTVAA